MPVPPDKRNYKHEYTLQKKRGEDEARHQRYLARKKIDEAGIDRKGKHVAHKKAIVNGGTNSRSNLEVVAPKKNLSYARRSNHTPKK